MFRFCVPLVAMLALAACQHRLNGEFAVQEAPQQLRPCPKSPNCVSTMADPADTQHYIAPIPYDGEPSAAIALMASIIERQRRTKIVTRTDNYLHATFTSALFRFVDDVEMLVDTDAKRIHLRSASRVGYSDLGVNRKRAEALIQAFRERSGGKHQ